MKLTSIAFSHGGRIPKEFTIQGKDCNPPFEIEGVPKNAKSLVLICEDPDVPDEIREDNLWNHWILFNLSPNLRGIEMGKEPPGVVGKGTGGVVGYQGPAPPPGKEHRYFFKLFALDDKLNLSRGVSKEEVVQAMQGHILAQTELMGTYET